MAQQTINIGTGANDGTGDNLRSAMDKTNDNFTELYGANSVSSNISMSGQTVSTYNTNGDLILGANGAGQLRIATNLIPDVNNTRYIGNANTRPLGIYVGTAGVISNGPLGLPTYANATVRDATITQPVDGQLILTGTDVQVYSSASWGAISSSGGFLSSVVSDTTPQLGGDLDLNSKNITGTGNIPAANLTGTLPALDGSALTNLTIPAQTFASLTSKPTTIAGYGIADALALGTSSTTALAGNTSIPSVLTDLGISDGTNSQVLTTNGSGTFTFQDASGGGSGLQSRSLRTNTTTSLADAAQADLDITGFKAYALLFITTDRAARVRLYVTAATRTADASRAEGVDPAADDGVIAEVITTGAETVIISPGAFGFNLESSTTTNIPCRVTNKSGSTSTVQVTLGVLQLEA
jgi:hypothetical protein